MSNITAIFTIQSGKVISPDSEKFKLAIQNLPDGLYLHSIERIYNKATAKQNRSCWGIPEKILRGCFMEQFGEPISKEYAHEIIMEYCLPEDYKEQLREDYQHNKKSIVNKLTGEVQDVPFRYTTTKMNTLQKNQYYKNMQRFGAEFFNVDIPSPDPNYNNHEPI